MKPSLLQKNIVVNGQFRLDLLDKHFFIKNGIISEEAFSKLTQPPIFNNFNAHIITEEFEITVNPVQLVIYSIKPDTNDNINEFLIKILKASQLNSFPSFGMNFHWALQFDSKELLQKKSRELFYNEKTEIISSFFNTDDSSYGFYASKDLLGGRLKLDIKPINSLNYPTKGIVQLDALYHQFNFHFNTEAEDVFQFLEKYSLYQKETEKIILTYK